MQRLIKIGFILGFVLVILVPIFVFSQDSPPKLSQEKLFQIIGEKEIQIRLQAEYIDNLLTQIKNLKEENEKLKSPKSSTNPN